VLFSTGAAAVVAGGAALAAAGYRIWHSVSLDLLSTDAVLYARMSSLVYQPAAERSRHDLMRNRRHGIACDGFELDPRRGMERTAVFSNKVWCIYTL
jgi:hypothetical protein